MAGPGDCFYVTPRLSYKSAVAQVENWLYCDHSQCKARRFGGCQE